MKELEGKPSEAFMKIAWQLWLPWQLFMKKKSNDISYEGTDPILMKFHNYLCDNYTKFS